MPLVQSVDTTYYPGTYANKMGKAQKSRGSQMSKNGRTSGDMRILHYIMLFFC
jgi:hypothetical protein